MANLRFTETSPASGIDARVVEYYGTTSSDLASDPMTLSIGASGVDVNGDPVVDSVNRSFDKADWTGEVIV